jgi:uncharacterized protein (TIGR00730 family)
MAVELRRLCVFSGSSFGVRDVYAARARALGAALAARRIGLVYGGGSVGLMGVLADAVLARRGEVIGVIPRALATKEVAHQRLADLRVVPSMHERKAMMGELADGFIALPGGFGTFEELFEVITWAQLGLHGKPIGVLDVDGYFDPFFTLIEQGIAEEFIRPDYRELVLRDDDPAALIEGMRAYRPPSGIRKWIGLAES